jgi:O-acetylserine/cysteine efflux transporter
MKKCYRFSGGIIRWCFMIVAGSLERVNRRDSLLAALVAALWGFNFVVIDWGMGAVPPLLFAAVRFAAVSAPALFVPRPAAPWRKVALVGLFMSLGQFAFLYASLGAGMPAGLASLVLQAQVAITAAIAAGVLRERPTAAQVAGIGLGAVGLVVVGAGRGGHVPLGALLLCLGAACSWAVGNVVSRAARVPGGFGLTVWSATVVPVPMLLLAVLVNGPGGVHAGLAAFGWKAAASTLYTAGLASLVGYAAWNGLLARYPSGAVVPWVLLVPPVGIVFAWLCLGERPGLAELAGGAVLVLGVLVAQGIVRAPARPARRRSAEDPGAESGSGPLPVTVGRRDPAGSL